jgi:DNA replication and repair protein RecF
VFVEQITLADFRNYISAELQPAREGVTLLQGENGAGKTNLLEAVAYLATLRSFRGAPAALLVRSAQQQAVLRARADRGGRSLLVEAELNLVGRDRFRLNRQPLRRNDDVLGSVLVTVFSPDDIEVVKGGPQLRRDYLDDLLVSLHPKHHAARAELERVLKQRNALLRSANGTLRPNMEGVLDVWDAKLAGIGETVAREREALVLSIQPEVDQAYSRLSTRATALAGTVDLSYERSWDGRLLDALHASRAEDVRRAVTSVGPQRDDLVIGVHGLAARTQASQGEQRSVALALRLGGHALVTDRQGTSPVLLLDDVFSELDPGRCAALASCLPDGQTLLTAAGPVPDVLPVVERVQVCAGTVHLGPALSDGGPIERGTARGEGRGDG